MPLRRFKPVTPARRYMSVSDFAEITKSKPEKALTSTRPGNAGRNAHGRITVRRRGGGGWVGGEREEEEERDSGGAGRQDREEGGGRVERQE